jgi:low affinity Fe/Cu permease
MNNLYRDLENRFERLTSIVTSILGNSVTFVLALVTVIFWLTEKEFYNQDLHHCISDVILGITFLSFFMIQKSFNRFSASLHLKLNELVSSHDNANNAIINVEHKTEEEIKELAKEYAEMFQIMEEETANEQQKKE